MEPRCMLILAAGTEPDVFVVADRDFGAWVKAGVLENLSPYIKNTTVFRYLKNDKIGNKQIYI